MTYQRRCAPLSGHNGSCARLSGENKAFARLMQPLRTAIRAHSSTLLMLPVLPPLRTRQDVGRPPKTKRCRPRAWCPPPR
eukprot:scaffold60340_cov32-Tisochrysis_lutea.AAC.3